jgi:hypothetical protein
MRLFARSQTVAIATHTPKQRRCGAGNVKCCAPGS